MFFWNRSGEPAAPFAPVAHSTGLRPPHPRVAAELAAMRELQGARVFMERAHKLHERSMRLAEEAARESQRVMDEAVARLDVARREVRRIAEAERQR